MRKIFSTLLTLCVIGGMFGISIFAQSNNPADSQDEQQKILAPKTLKQNLEDIKKGIQDGTLKPEDLPPHLLFLFNDDQNIPEPIQAIDNSEIVSCFDYYTFGSIDADISSGTSSVVSGTSMAFTATLTNNNPYPIVEGTLYVKIFKNTGGEKNPNGPDVVDQFVAVDNITLPANGSAPVSFTWQVPAYATSGEYRLGTYFISDKKFNLLGLSFTDDIVGNMFPFTVSGEQKNTMLIDKSSVTINDNSYYFAAYPPRIESDNQANISLTVTNDTPYDQVAQIEWKLYKWDVMNETNLVKTFNTATPVKSNSTEKVSVEIPEQEEPVYLLVGTMTYQDTKSIVNIRYVREGVDKVRLNFPSLTSYPIQKDVPMTLFTCLHNSGQSAQVTNNKVVLEVVNKKGEVVESYEYTGIVTGDMMAVKKDFIPKTSLDTFSVHASLYTDGKLVDESVMEYDCQLIDPTKCSPEEKDVFGTKGTDKSLVGVLILLLITIGILVLVFKRKHHTVVSLLLFVSLGCIFVSPAVEAKSTTWNHTYKKDFGYYYSTGASVSEDFAVDNPLHWTTGLKNPNVTVQYDAIITNLDTNKNINDGDSVPVGTKLRLKFPKHNYTDISWVGTGYSADSPYGHWKANASAPPEDTCKQDDFVRKYTDNNQDTYSVFIPLMMDQPTKTITGENTMSCGAKTGNEENGFTMDCTVTKAGTLKPTFNFSATNGEFFYRYIAHNSINGIKKDTCISNNVPMREGDAKYVTYYGYSWWTIENIKNFKVSVPAQTISYTFTAFTPPPANRLPLAPTITGPATGYVSTTYTFNFRATDPDGDAISYGVDWDYDGVVDQWLPSSTSTVASGTLQSATKSWSTAGAKTFQALTKDSKGAVSASWGRFTITLAYPPVNGVCTLSAQTITPNQPITWTITPSGGTGAYTYSWSGTDIPTTPTTNPITKIYTASGTKTATVIITSGTQTKTITCQSAVVLDDICGNIGDFQGTTPTGLKLSGGNCVCEA